MYHVQKVYLFAPRQSSVGFLDWVSQSWIHNPGLGFACMLSFILFLFGQVAFSFTFCFFYGKESRKKVGLPLSKQKRTNCVFSLIKKYNIGLDNGWIHFSSFLRQNLFFASWLALGDVHNLSRLKDGRGCTLRTLCCEIKYFVHTQFRLPKDGVTLCVHCEL